MSNFVQFDCPECGQPIEAPSDGVGQSVLCPHCNRGIIIPAPVMVRALPQRRSSRASKILAACVTLLALGAYAISPFLTLKALDAAIRKGDTHQIKAMIDFPMLRESLKAEMVSAVTKTAASDPEMASNPFTGLATLAMPAILGGMIDAHVTPNGIANLAKEQGMAGKVCEPKIAGACFVGLTRFECDIEGGTRVTLRVRDLGWKVTDLHLGPEVTNAFSESLGKAMSK